MIRIELADRVKNLPPYLFETIDEMKRQAVARGVDVIDLSIGDPDIPTPKHIVEAMQLAVTKPAHHQYPSYAGMLSYRTAVADWYKTRFNVELDPKTEVLALLGSKEGIGHVPLAFVNPGDIVLVPSPGYPVYPVGTLFAGGESYIMPILEQNNYLPDFKIIPPDVLKRAKIMYLNYPNNPTSACAPKSFFEEAVALAKKYDIIICHDAAYSEVYFDNKPPVSFLETEGAKEVGIEFHSLSKTYNMTGWRIGFAVGNAAVIAGLGRIKSQLDSGAFHAIQEASIAAIKTEDAILAELRNTFQERRDVMYSGLTGLGLKVNKPQASFYLWANVPKGYNSTSFVAHLLEKAGVLGTPGVGFGAPGEGYIRFALTQKIDRIKEAVERIKKVL